MKSGSSIIRSERNPGLPTVRIIHHMARTGGTVICRCLASMQGVVLLSEVHPLGTRAFNPLLQAHAWYGLLSKDDLESARSRQPSFLEAIQLIAQRCAEQGKTLVLRDWSHLDYTGVPFAQPTYRSLLAEALQQSFALVRYASVRHPLDQWLSVRQQAVFQGRLGPARFLRGAVRFAETAAGMGFVRYEDFTRDSDRTLQQLCAGLALGFDPEYRKKWSTYTNITGDVLPGRAGGYIAPLQRQPLSAAEQLSFCSSPQYAAIIHWLGYDD